MFLPSTVALHDGDFFLILFQGFQEAAYDRSVHLEREGMNDMEGGVIVIIQLLIFLKNLRGKFLYSAAFSLFTNVYQQF